MPVYEFRCETCGTFELLRPMSEASNPTVCQTCQVVAKRIYSVAGLIATPSALSHRIDRSAEPRVVKHSQHESTASHKHHGDRHHHQGRPWMVGH